ncbi:MAG: VWA domain-containing protein, partial [Verrucomicrobia bacterium]|nr:VWA domain-containing protein [Verrucomicrobiota bacterium]
KRFCEEWELTIIFLVDISGSMIFGSGLRSKAEVAAELTSLLALSAIKNQDKVGMILFSDRIERYIPPRKGRTAAMRLVREVLAAEETRRETNLGAALQFLNKVQKHRAVVFLISDFLTTGYEKELRVMARRHDLIACPISDPREQSLPNIGLLEVVNPETGDLMIADTSSHRLLQSFQAQAATEELARDKQFQRLKVDRLALATDRPFVDDVRRLFHLRQHRMHRG